MKLNRRDALYKIGLGSAGLMLACLNKTSATKSDKATNKLEQNYILKLSENIRKIPSDNIFDLASREIKAGIDYKSFLAAIFLAGIYDIKPRHVGGKLHAIMEIESMFQLAESAPIDQAWSLTLWSLADFKRSQQRDIRDGDWSLPARPNRSFSSEKQARSAFLAAMNNWDDKKADEAIVGLIPFHNQDSLFEIIWPLAARCFIDIGHKIIYTVQIERVLRRIGWQYAEVALRSLTNALLHFYSKPLTNSFEQSQTLMSSFPKNWLNGKDDVEQSKSLMKKLKDYDSKQAQDLIIAGLNDGLAPKTLWDGLRLFASEIFLRRPELLPVHAVTVTNAYGYAWRTTNDEVTKKLLILQSAAWLMEIKEFLVNRTSLTMQTSGFDRPLLTDKTSLEQIFEEPSYEKAKAYLDDNSNKSNDYVNQLRNFLSRKVTEHHQPKYMAAMLEESKLINAQHKSYILSPAIAYLPALKDPDNELFPKVLYTLKKIGIY